MTTSTTSKAYNAFAKRLRSRRKSLLLNQKSLAKKIGVSPDRYEQIESGDRFPLKRELLKLTMELRTSEDWLVNGGY